MLSERLSQPPTAAHRRITALIMTVVLAAAACGSGSGESTPSVEATSTTMSDRDEDFVANSAESTPGTDPDIVSTPTTPDTLGGGGRAPAIPDAELPLSIIEIDFEAGTVTIANHGPDEVDLGEVWICEFPDYAPLDTQLLPAGESVKILNPHDSSSDEGELALYRTNDFGSADAILSYVEWGNADHTRSSVAVEAGVWGTGAVDAGLVLATGGIFAVDAADWSVLTSLSGEQHPAPSAPASTPSSPATTSAPTPPPDDYSPPAPPTTSAPTAPPPDEY